MFEWLFPNWSNPGSLAAIVGIRTILNVSFVAITANAVGVKTPYTSLIAGLTILSTAIMVLSLRPGVLGLHASYVELLVQVIIFLGAGYAVYAEQSLGRWIAFALVFLVAVPLLLVMIPIYGEAFVAP